MVRVFFHLFTLSGTGPEFEPMTFQYNSPIHYDVESRLEPVTF